VTGVSDVPGEPAPEHERRPGWLEHDMPAYRFGIVLALLFATFIFLASGPTGDWVPFAAVLLQGATLLAALAAADVSYRIWRFAAILVGIAMLSALGVWSIGEGSRSGILLVLNAVLVAIAPVVIARSLVRRRIIDLKTVMGALCIYVLLGMLWAFTFGAIGAIQDEEFFAQHIDPTLADYLYFSFVTLTTTGYGDLTAASGLGRAVAVLEALLGQLYLVTVVAVIVSRLARRSTSDVRKGTPPDDAG
jgi:hypothetical protein